MKKIGRIRDFIDIPGRFQPGIKNSITDVPEVTCGHFTLVKGDNVRTGITVISPIKDDVFLTPIPAAVQAGNGFGKMTGSLQVEELGEMESLIGLTNTLSVPAVLQGLINYHIPNLPDGLNSINVLVGETNDSPLNDIRGCHITPEHVSEAILNLSGQTEEGSVGAGAGTVCFGFKGGIGTASRIIPGDVSGEFIDYTIGALVQSNYSGNLTIYEKQLPLKPLEKFQEPENGSCMIIVATNAPLSSRQLKRLAKRALIGLSNTGSCMHNGSGDFCISFSNFMKNRRKRIRKGQNYYFLSDTQLNPFFEACADAVQEALYNSLTMSKETTSNGKTIPGFDISNF